ncbi:stressosome-associated protein Prli42 [Pullulanibacillus sp. KACC 23026]|nr:stressosome-associated protein Prli42 [Pullulanibacillus sp. KACC 23026]WEG14343.1 stressosome-associated protein Prli42 [Pullulanibacillus sp. KACC 23026]
MRRKTMRAVVILMLASLLITTVLSAILALV